MWAFLTSSVPHGIPHDVSVRQVPRPGDGETSLVNFSVRIPAKEAATFRLIAERNHRTVAAELRRLVVETVETFEKEAA